MNTVEKKSYNDKNIKQNTAKMGMEAPGGSSSDKNNMQACDKESKS